MFQVERLKARAGNEELGGLPIVSLDGCGLFEPAVSYISSRRNVRSLSLGTLEDEAYIIALWCNFVQQRGSTWSSAVEADFVAFKQFGEKAKLAPARQGRRFWVITNWYFFLTQKGIGGRHVKLFCACLTQTPLQSDVISPEPRYKAPAGPKNKNGPRNTPLGKDLDAVLEVLASHKQDFIADRNFVMASTILGTGLRSMGLHSLTLGFIDDLLRSVRVIGETESVAWLGNQKPERDRIRAELLRREELRMRPMFGRISEKGGKVRQVRFFPKEVLLILSHIWGSRYRLVQDRHSGRGCDALWLSARDASPLALGSIKDVLKKAFTDAKIEGSGHRLRASFLTMKAVELIKAAREQYRAVDGDTILAQLALIAGHASTKDLKSYLTDAAELLSLLDSEVKVPPISFTGRPSLR